MPGGAERLSAPAGLARPNGRDRPRHRIDIDADEALAEARAAEPATPRPSQPQEGDPLPGQRARVRASDNAKDWIEGEVHFIDADEIALLHENDEVGKVAVHFPRLGYDWRVVTLRVPR